MEAVLKRKLGRESRDYLAITFGLICYSLGWAAFLLPYQITTGGVTGIAAIIIMPQVWKCRFPTSSSMPYFWDLR